MITGLMVILMGFGCIYIYIYTYIWDFIGFNGDANGNIMGLSWFYMVFLWCVCVVFRELVFDETGYIIDGSNEVGPLPCIPLYTSKLLH